MQHMSSKSSVKFGSLTLDGVPDELEIALFQESTDKIKGKKGKQKKKKKKRSVGMQPTGDDEF
ncbi:hypothetical protein OUZ56_031048 [Daphnia magna]|uniref:Uncharacterized protein n=1 Tax=Daphnia magna TaxID=35525 RepID=A0ABQ9ZTG3_9CRUS|nr:hypothetical protein OUZ56_031048 [Daphnia magna]